MGEEVLSGFVPEDRLRALATGEPIAGAAVGAVLFVDVAGFTPLTDTLVRSLGPQRGAEELTLLLDRVFAALVEAVEWLGGTVVAFAGDALSCWFDADDGLQATAAALAMQTAMAPLRRTPLPDGATATLATRAAVATGTVERLVLGDPAVQVVEALAGEPVDAAARGQQAARPGEVVLAPDTAAVLRDRIELAAERDGFPVVARLRAPFAPTPPAPYDPPGPEALRPWVPEAVYEHVRRRGDAPMAEIRPAVALFAGLDGTGDLDAAVRHAQHVLASYGGTLIDVTTGDKGTYLSGAFGVPVAHGDDLLRSVAAAHELCAPTTRIGLAAGPVYASVYGAPERRCYGLNGSTVNLAARLMQHAPTGAVRLSGGFGPGTARRFQILTLPPLALKGFPAPVPAAELVGPRTEPAVMPAEPRYTVPLVGRHAELRQGLAALRRAGDGAGQALAVTGPAGIGKSRLLAEVARLAAGAGFEVHAGAGDAVASVPYLGWRPVWRGLLGLAPEDGEGQLREALAAIDPALPGHLPLLAPLLGLDVPDNEVTSTIPAQARGEVVKTMLRRCLAARAAATPLLIAIEDCQWLDSLSRDLLSEVAGWIAALPVLLVATSRPDAPVPLPDRIDLRPLSPDESAQLIELKLCELSGRATDVPDALVRGVTERADGNPFFVEELLNHLHDLGLERIEQLDLPPTVHGLILQRLDRLPAQDQLTLKPAAVIGRRFRSDWVCTLDPRLGSPDEVASSLEAVARHDLIAHEADISYLFKHIATWEAVYQSVPFAARAAWHGELARRLMDAGDVAPAVLAHHFRRAGDRPNELRYALAAGEQAAAAGAYREAREHLERGLDLVTADDAATELGLQLSLGGVLLTTHGQASPAAKAHFDRALRLTERLAPGPELARARFGLWTYYLFRGDIRQAGELSRQILALAGDPEQRLQAHFAVSATVYWLAEFDACIEHADAVDRLYDPTQATRYLATYAQNPRITAAADAAWAEWIVGRPDSARRRATATVEHARELDQPFPLTIALQVPAIVAVHVGDVEAAAVAAQEWLESATRVGNPVYIGLAAACLAWANGAVEELAAVRRRFVDEGVELPDPLLTTMLADAHLRRGDPAGLELLGETMDAAAARGQLAYQSEQHRLRGELRLLAGEPGEDDIRRALAIAREQGARSYELRAALSLARLTGREEELGRARAAIAEGADTPDLRAVDTLLQGGTLA